MKWILLALLWSQSTIAAAPLDACPTVDLAGAVYVDQDCARRALTLDPVEAAVAKAPDGKPKLNYMAVGLALSLGVLALVLLY